MQRLLLRRQGGLEAIVEHGDELKPKQRLDAGQHHTGFLDDAIGLALQGFAAQLLLAHRLPRAFVKITHTAALHRRTFSCERPVLRLDCNARANTGTRSPYVQSTLSFGRMCPTGLQRCIRSFPSGWVVSTRDLAERSRAFLYRAAIYWFRAVRTGWRRGRYPISLRRIWPERKKPPSDPARFPNP